MLSREHRLADSADFQLVFGHGKSFANRNLVLYHRRRNDEGPFRLGLSVSKKIGNAVMRNQIRRLLSEAFRTVLLEASPQLDGVDLVIIARIPAAQLEYRDFIHNVKHLLERSGYIKKQ
ncbi:MAG: ribonuclease protein component [Bacilli bacterium]|nr:ribonuclease protein component [Bacilli bacterium]